MKASPQPHRSQLIVDLMGYTQSNHPDRPHVSSVMQRFTAGRQFEACPGSYQGKHVHDACFRSFEVPMPQERAGVSSPVPFPSPIAIWSKAMMFGSDKLSEIRREKRNERNRVDN